jgi:hypothetical protein
MLVEMSTPTIKIFRKQQCAVKSKHEIESRKEEEKLLNT